MTKPEGTVSWVRFFVAAVLFLGLVAACVRAGEAAETEAGPDCTASPAFGARLLEAVSGGGARNAAVSPLGAGVVLAMMAEGGAAPVRAAIRDLAGASPGCALAEILDSAATDNRVKTRIASGAFVDSRLALFPDFRSALRERFDARVETFDFADPVSADTVNAWASEKTDGAIQSAVERLNPDDELALANAIHFHGKWTNRFDRGRTAPAPFWLRSGEIVEVPAMRADDLDALYRVDADFEAVSLPYGDGAFAFAAVLPREGMAPEDALARLAEDPSPLAGEGFDIAVGALQLPRLALDGKVELLPVLRALGLAVALDDEDAFAGIAAPPPALSRLVQRVAIEVDESGTKASTATFGMTVPTSIPVRFDLRFDRPFAFSVRHIETGAILFTAWVDNPAAGAGR